MTNLELDKLHGEWKRATGRKKEALLLKLSQALNTVGYAIVWNRIHGTVAGTRVDREIVHQAVSFTIQEIDSFKGVSKTGIPTRFSSWYFQRVKNLCYRTLRQKIQKAEVPLELTKETAVHVLGAAGDTSGNPNGSSGALTTPTTPHEWKVFEDTQAGLEAKITLDWLSRGLTDDEKELLKLKLEGLTYEEISQYYLKELSNKGAEARFNRLRKKLLAKAGISDPLV